jgi:hypothetical protein
MVFGGWPLTPVGLVRGASDSPGQPPSPPPSSYDLRRQALLEQFTAQQEAANWPEKFQRIGNEMGVPPDVLAAVAFTETRWEQLAWPPGETASPETGLPHPYGVMSLWDNDVLGHSLIDAAALIGSTPDALKADPELNIRGAAALLKQYYDANPLPAGTSAQDIESWQNAIVKYCGIQDAYLSCHHAFNCYLAMSQGYDQYGMHWKPHPVRLEAMRARLKTLRADHDALIPAPTPAASAPPVAQEETSATHPPPAQRPELTSSWIAPQPSHRIGLRWVIAGMVLALLAFLLSRRREKPARP